MAKPHREPRPTDLLAARDIADELGWDLNRSENVLRVIARAHGGAIRIEGVRRIFIRRDWLEASISQASS